MADLRPGLSDFWRTAVFADAYRRKAEVGTAYSDGGEVSRSVAGRLEAASLLAAVTGRVDLQLESVSIVNPRRSLPDGLHGMDAPARPPIPLPNGWGDDEEKPDWRELPLTLSNTDICCATGDYPSQGPEDLGGQSRTTGLWMIGFRFRAKAVYKNTGEEAGKSCRCSCCHFYQYIVRDEVTIEMGVKSPDAPEPPLMDCTWVVFDVRTKKTIASIPPTKKGPKEKPRVAEGHDVRWECYGQDPPIFKSEAEFDAAADMHGLIEDRLGGKCIFLMRDKPSVEPVNSGALVTRDWLSLGIVWDSFVGRNIELGALAHMQRIRASRPIVNQAR